MLRSAAFTGTTSASNSACNCTPAIRKRRNVYRIAIAYAVIAWLLMQIATLHHSLNFTRLLVRFDHVVSFIEHANHT
jgi:hypothetical protein